VILIGTNSGDRPLVIDQSLVIDFELLLFGKDGVRIPCEYLRNPERPEPGAAAWRPRLVELPPGQSIRRRIRLDGYEVFVTYHSSTMKDGLVLHGPEMGQEIVCGLPSDVPAGVVHRIQVTHEGWRRNRDAIVQFTDLDPESIGLYEGRASAELTLAD
jgi:hypothetical protein